MFPIDDMRMTPNQRVMIGNFKHDSGLFGTLLSRIDVLAAVHIPNMSKKVEMFTQNDCKEAKLEIQKDFSYKNSPHWFREAHWFDGVVTAGPHCWDDFQVTTSTGKSNPPEGVTIGPCWTSALLRRICAKPGPKNLRELVFGQVSYR